MRQIIKVKVDKLLFWLENYRFGSASSQEDALQKLTDTKHFNLLVESIRKHGFQENNLLTVSENRENPGKYLVYDGNRRLAAVKHIPEINSLQVYQEEGKDALNAILAREHSNDPAGRLKWTAVQQARWDKSLYKQDLKPNLPQNAMCLAILEQSQDRELDSSFPLSTFERLYSNFDFSNKFDIDVSSDPPKVGKKDEINAILDDIGAKRINSRNINTVDNIKKYLEQVLAGWSQDERTNLVDDNESEEQIEDDEEQNPTRLFTQDELRTLTQHIKNNSLKLELERAPTGRYPHLLTLATRGVLDTLRNIDKQERPPKALSTNDISKYIKSNAPLTGKARTLLDTLAEHSHDLSRKSTSAHIDNSREIVARIIQSICESIE